MASVVYVTDQQMISYHRLKGSTELNFWRPLSQTRMKHFHPGDLIFFLTTTDGVKHTKEKGIVGYGRYEFAERLSLNRMWQKYGDGNGYDTKEKLKKAILERGGRIPERISCLHINHVLFFAEPLYLSQIGMNIPANLESFAYLQTDKTDYTYALLEQAKKIGLDYWSTKVEDNPAQEEDLQKDLRRYRVLSLSREAGHISFNKTILAENKRMMKELIKKDQGITPVSYDASVYYKDDGKLISIYIPALVNTRETDKIQELIGYISLWKGMASYDEIQYQFVIITRVKTEQLLKSRYVLWDNVSVRPVE